MPKNPPARGLIVLSAVERLPNGRPAGFWLPEAAYPWRALLSAGWDFRFAATAAGAPPAGGVDRSDPPQRMFLGDARVAARLADTVTADLLDPADYGVVFVAGGHGALFDLPGDRRLSGFLGAFHAAGGVIAAVCHGVAALLDVPRPDGGALIEGLRLTGFSRAEERAAGLAGVLPFFLDEALTARGARYEAGEPFRSHVVCDGTVVTGQNPASAAAVTEAGMALATGRPLAGNWLRAPAPAH
ncbi:type 1 glutamine amidotransferase domain-containing protein [Streptomyces marincola]|uniref:DJ-1/PfpI domain-containing protein n=1 Tax=Streptomyces marincola TaxID=2878388 RepID=A0A1W7CRY3_9ACTN|nr:type 1 glutamine amidotransferase domain-containing protein [Streptomyces marincola]ARQ67548.1 hypothetical protein CAG99_00745 [Streptomyces marincola]